MREYAPLSPEEKKNRNIVCAIVIIILITPLLFSMCVGIAAGETKRNPPAPHTRQIETHLQVIQPEKEFKYKSNTHKLEIAVTIIDGHKYYVSRGSYDNLWILGPRVPDVK